MAAPSLLLSPRVQRPLVLWTPPSSAIKMPHCPLSSHPTQCHPPRQPAPHILKPDPTASRTASRAPEAHLTPRDAIPPLNTTGAHEVQPAATKREARLQATNVMTSHLTLLHCTPP